MSDLVQEDRLTSRIGGFPAMIAATGKPVYQALSAEYAASQLIDNVTKTSNYLEPILRDFGANTVLDAGCGVGTMVRTLLDHGYDAYGFDLLENVTHWADQHLPPERFVVTDPLELRLPFADGSFDAVYSFGVIEHVGTHDGHATRRPDYHDIRTQWVGELFRVIKVGGHLLLGGPNKGFPVDTAHDLDAAAAPAERWLRRRVGVSIHRTWGSNFLWSYGDVRRYTAGLPCSVQGLSVQGLANFGRIPWPMKGAAQAYVRHLPRAMLASGFNPWVMAAVRRLG